MLEKTRSALAPARTSPRCSWTFVATCVLGGWSLGGLLVACGGNAADGAGAGGTASGGALASSGGSGGSAPIASGGAASGGTIATEDLCFDPEAQPVCGENVGFWAPYPALDLAVAADIVPAAAFVAGGGLAALLEVPHTPSDERYRVVRVVWHEGRAEVLTVTWPDAAGDWSVRHVWADLGFASTVSFTGVDTVALACDSERCLLLGADEDETTLVPLPGTELPADADVDRLAFRDEAALCAYGAQLYCLGEGGWTLATSVPVGAGTRFTHVLPSPPAPEPDTIPVIGAAATDTGAVLVELQPGNWTLARPASSASGAVVALEGKYELVSVVFESGLWLGDLVGQSLLPCERNGLAWFAPIRPEVDTWVGATESGDVFLHEHERGTGNISWCGLDRDLEADILGLSLRTCGIANGILVLTPTRLTSLFGEPHCAVD